MSEIVTITRHELSKKCSDAMIEMFHPDKNRDAADFHFMMIMTVFSGLVVHKVFDEEEQDDEENVSVNN